MNKLFLLWFVLIFLSCKNKEPEWHTLNFGAFKIKAPQGWKIIPQKSFDSYFGSLSDNKNTIWFDYGMYSVDFVGREDNYYRHAKDTVNGLLASITIPDTAGKGLISMHIAKIKENTKFTIWTESKQTEMILKMYKSIIFKNIDTLKNPPLSLKKFTFSIRGGAKTLFEQNCAMCHKLNGSYMTGPPLTKAMRNKTSEWVFKFLTSQKTLIGNTFIYQNKKYDIICGNFSDFTKSDVEALVNYIQGQDSFEDEDEFNQKAP
ncbi:hypothetical protein AD998_13660 [bacterium 336/3]|nr:hypothetical protein AD998_13660 [bacterium 336/3]